MIRPSRGWPPVACSRGVGSRKAANSLPLENAPKSWTLARKRVEKNFNSVRRLTERAMTTKPVRVNAHDPLGQIKPDARDRRGIDDRLAHGRPRFLMVLSTTTILARLMPLGAAVHPIRKGARADLGAMLSYSSRLKVRTFSPAPPSQNLAHACISSRRLASASERR